MFHLGLDGRLSVPMEFFGIIIGSSILVYGADRLPSDLYNSSPFPGVWFDGLCVILLEKQRGRYDHDHDWGKRECQGHKYSQRLMRMFGKHDFAWLHSSTGQKICVIDEGTAQVEREAGTVMVPVWWDGREPWLTLLREWPADGTFHSSSTFTLLFNVYRRSKQKDHTVSALNERITISSLPRKPTDSSSHLALKRCGGL